MWFRLLARLKRTAWLQLFVVYTRYLIGGAFVFASIVKIQGLRFTSGDGSGAPLDSPFHLFEVFYRSGLWWEFIGWAQLIAGGLMMTQRYAKLGAVLFLPIIANVFVLTISYDFAGTPVITGLMLLGTLGLVLWEWDTLRVLVNLPAQPIDGRNPQHQVFAWTGGLLLAWTVGYRASNPRYDFFLWAFVCAGLGLGGLLVSWWRSRQRPVATA